MERPVARVSLTLFSFALAALLGCEGQTEYPVDPGSGGPQFKRGGGEAGKPLADVMASGAIVTPPSQPMEIWKEDEQILALQANASTTGAASVAVGFNASKTAALAVLNDDGTFSNNYCSVVAGTNTAIPELRIRNAITKLVNAQKDRAFHVHVAKSGLGLPSDGHRFSVHWLEPEGQFSMGVGTYQGIGDPTTVKLLGGDINLDSYLEYSGGSVDVKDRSKRPHFTVVCPNLDPATVTITRR